MGVLLLMWELLNTGLETFPPVTILVVAGQVIFYDCVIYIWSFD